MLGSIEVSTHLDAAKFDADAQKVRVLRSLPRENFRLHWTSAPACFLVAVAGPAKLETAGKWLARRLEEAHGESSAWQLPGAILVIGDDHSDPGLVCYWHVSATDHITFNPEEAHGVCCLKGAADSLPVFLLLLMSELRRVVTDRAKAVAANHLLGRVSKPRTQLLNAGDVEVDPEEMFAEVADAVATALAHIPDLSAYFEAGLVDRLSTAIVKIEAD